MFSPDDLAQYRQMITDLASSADGRVIYNERADHAKIIIESIFTTAQKEILILTGALAPSIFGSSEVSQKAVSFLESNSSARIKIISDQPLNEDHPLLKAVHRQNLSERLHIRNITRDAMNEIPCHFMVADAYHFRFEKDKNEFGAITQFGEGIIGNKLKSMFDTLFEKSLTDMKDP